MDTPTRPLTPDEHRQRHGELHAALDALLADFLQHALGDRSLQSCSILALTAWSYLQTQIPDHPPTHAPDDAA